VCVLSKTVNKEEREKIIEGKDRGKREKRRWKSRKAGNRKTHTLGSL